VGSDLGRSVGIGIGARARFSLGRSVGSSVCEVSGSESRSCAGSAFSVGTSRTGHGDSAAQFRGAGGGRSAAGSGRVGRAAGQETASVDVNGKVEAEVTASLARGAAGSGSICGSVGGSVSGSGRRSSGRSSCASSEAQGA
jgi:hypothetical protein